MKEFKLTFQMLALQLLVFGCGTPQPIEAIFPKAFSSGTGIQVREKEIDNLRVYQIDLFPEGNCNHYDDRPSDIQIKHLVMHYTVCDFPATIQLFTKNIPEGRVSAHYVIAEAEKENQIQGGKIIQIVPEEKRAWHAGISSWKGVQNLNPYSIGIENVNKGFTQQIDGNNKVYLQWYPFDQAQVAALGKLSQGIVKKYNIHPTNVVGHADIAPTRKQDPGILFPWEVLYTKFGVGAWLEEKERDEAFIQNVFMPKEKLPQDASIPFLLSNLQAYGYAIEDPAYMTPANRSVVTAFQAHFSRNQQPWQYGSEINRRDLLWIYGLNGKYKDVNH